MASMTSDDRKRTGEATIKLEFLREKTRQDGDKKERGDLETPEGGPPKKKQKSRGSYKRRPREKRQPEPGELQLCPSLVRDGECRFGEKCRYSHDIQAYMARKSPDLGSTCSNFERLGFCSQGVQCRFAGSHLTDDFKNIVDQPKVDSLEQPQSLNRLSKELQKILRKRALETPETDRFLSSMESIKESGLSFSEWEEKKVKETSVGVVTDEDSVRLRPLEKKTIDFRDKLYLAPLTTVGNLPFRRVCKSLGVDITCGEMAMCTNLLQGQQSEWALLRRHRCEDLFGVQVCGSFPDSMTRCAEMLKQNVVVDFVDINVGCPIDLVFKKGGGCGLMQRVKQFEAIVRGMSSVLDNPLTVKMRTGVYGHQLTAHKIIPKLHSWGASLVTLHGRSREQRYTRLADWEYVDQCAKAAEPIPLFGNGDILSYEDANAVREKTGVAGVMIARGALIKPWIFTEIKEQRHWDISSQERLEIVKKYVNYGLEHWGSDQEGIDKTRRFLLEWLSFLHRYIPVGLLEFVPQKMNERPPLYCGRDELETLMASPNSADWVKISEMLLGPVSPTFSFLPKHRANSYA
eukprot:m.54019 g.54019  ORF g.54019 m.54019 type:complete len:575 (+) comp34302_c0_seq1:173-1897(+)